MITLVNLHGLASAKPNHIIEPSLAGHDSSSLIEASLQTNPTSDGYVAEATRPLLVLEKNNDNELVEICLQQFCSNMHRNIQCFDPFGYEQFLLWLREGAN